MRLESLYKRSNVRRSARIVPLPLSVRFHWHEMRELRRLVLDGRHIARELSVPRPIGTVLQWSNVQTGEPDVSVRLRPWMDGHFMRRRNGVV